MISSIQWFSLTVKSFSLLSLLILLSVSSAAITFYSFERFRLIFESVANEEINSLVVISRLGQQNDAISSNVLALINAQKHSQRVRAEYEIYDRMIWIDELVEEMKDQARFSVNIQNITLLVNELKTNLSRLNQEVKEHVSNQKRIERVQRLFNYSQSQSISMIMNSTVSQDKKSELVNFVIVSLSNINHHVLDKIQNEILDDENMLVEKIKNVVTQNNLFSIAPLQNLLEHSQSLLTMRRAFVESERKIQQYVGKTREVLEQLAIVGGYKVSNSKARLIEKQSLIKDEINQNEIVLITFIGLTLFGVIFITVYIHRSIVMRIRKLHQTLLDKSETLDQNSSLQKYDELDNISQAIDNYIQITEEKEKTINDKRLQAEEISRTDVLTGILNRRAFFDDSANFLNDVRREGDECSLLELDIDFFKKINDTYGHAAGDEALRKIVLTISNIIRKKDVFGRIGGEEFAIFLPHTNGDKAKNLANRICEGTQAISVRHKKSSFSFTVSIGVTEVKGKKDNLELALGRADEALYQAKENGRNCVFFCSS